MSASILSRIVHHAFHRQARWKVAAVTLALGATSAVAAIVGTAPAFIQILPPPSVQLNQLTSDTNLFAFNERQCFTLAFDLHTDNGAIPANTLMSSHFLHGNPNTSLLLDGRVQFNGPVIGVISSTALLNASDVPCGAAGTIYPTGTEPNRGLEPAQADTYAIISGGFGIAARMEVPPSSFSDQIRVLTRCCPDGACPGAPD